MKINQSLAPPHPSPPHATSRRCLPSCCFTFPGNDTRPRRSQSVRSVRRAERHSVGSNGPNGTLHGGLDPFHSIPKDTTPQLGRRRSRLALEHRRQQLRFVCGVQDDAPQGFPVVRRESRVADRQGGIVGLGDPCAKRGIVRDGRVLLHADAEPGHQCFPEGTTPGARKLLVQRAQQFLAGLNVATGDGPGGDPEAGFPLEVVLHVREAVELAVMRVLTALQRCGGEHRSVGRERRRYQVVSVGSARGASYCTSRSLGAIVDLVRYSVFGYGVGCREFQRIELTRGLYDHCGCPCCWRCWSLVVANAVAVAVVVVWSDRDSPTTFRTVVVELGGTLWLLLLLLLLLLRLEDANSIANAPACARSSVTGGIEKMPAVRILPSASLKSHRSR